MPGSESRQLPVLYVGGYQRSGSTLLSRLLGELPGTSSVGEMRFLWSRGLQQNALCGCGRRFRDCDFWSAVGDEAFGGWDTVDAEEMVRLDRAVDRLWTLPLLLVPGLSPSFSRRLRAYADALDRVYRAIARVSGSSVIVDSTKDPPFAFVLRHVPSLRLRVVHLIRDSRGVAYSWTKRMPWRELVDGRRHMDQFRPSESGLRWMMVNSLFHLLARLGVPTIVMRYEALVASPATELRRAATHGGAAVDGFEFLGDGNAQLGPHHAFSGNPLRYETGPVPLELDEAWKTRMPPFERRLVSLLTWPLLWRYGYLRGARRL